MKQQQDEAGLLVFIGSGRKASSVFVGWARVGGELELRDQVQGCRRERVLVLGTADATKSEVERFRATHQKSRAYGYCFSRTKRFDAAMRKAINTEAMLMRRAA